MLNEYAYCPRLFHFMHVEGRWEENQYTLEGTEAHRRVDRREGRLRGPNTTVDDSDDGDAPPAIARSVALASETLGISAKLDLVETAGDRATPVDTKRGRVPKNAERSWEPERVQVMAQGLLLREHGYQCDEGVLYFAGSRTRVTVPFTPELESLTRQIIDSATVAAKSDVLPPPLEDSPKCNGCSLSGICLPDETVAMRSARARDVVAEVDGDAEVVRRLYPPRDATLPLYVQEQGAQVGKRGERLVITKGGEELATARLKDVSQLVVMGGVAISAQTIHLLCDAGVPIVHVSRGHWFYGVTQGITLRNAFDRAAQHRAAADPARALAFARNVVAAKGANQRTLIGRNVRPRPIPTLKAMSKLIARSQTADSLEELLGVEGGIAAHYFASFGDMLRPRDFDAAWDFASRNRRPPRDPINAMLSLGYALLAKECTVALLAEGLDPWWGLYHQPRHGRPSLALDLMEEFRPLIVDSAVLTAVNTGMVATTSFVRSAGGCAMTSAGRKDFIRAYEARLDQLVTHPMFGYRCSWRSVIRVQARLLSRWLRGDVPSYESIRTR
jgi:CRISPR-associated protein Cas1